MSTSPHGTATVGDIELPVPGPIKIVDHALSRAARRGAIVVLEVEGEDNPEIYDAGEEDE
jgi:nitrite reductase (NO-forming)